MLGSAIMVVAELPGGRQVLSIDRGHQLTLRDQTGGMVTIESRPVTDFAAAVDRQGKLHVAAWLLSRHLMYYTSTDGHSFTRSTLIKGDGQLRMKELLLWADEDVAVVYLAESDFNDTLVCYRHVAGDWEGKRLAEVQLPDRLMPLQFDNAPGGLGILYSIKTREQTTVAARSLEGGPPETVAASADGFTDFCAVTTGGVRHVCWTCNGYLFADNTRLSDQPWTRSYPYLKRETGGLNCLWLEDGMLAGCELSPHRRSLKPVAIKDPLPCRLALPGELRRAIVESRTLSELMLASESPSRSSGLRPVRQGGQVYQPELREQSAGPQDLSLTEVVRNQALYMTRMQESVSAMERNMLRLQSDVNRLNKEVSALLRSRVQEAAPVRQEPDPPEPPKEQAEPQAEV